MLNQTRPKHTIPQAVAAAVASGKRVRLQVLSGSMQPTLETSDVVEIRQADVKDLRSGDVIVVAKDDTLVVHRLLSVRRTNGPTALVTKWDAHYAADKPWPVEQFAGRVSSVYVRQKRMDFTSTRWQLVNRAYGRIAQVESATLTALYRWQPAAFTEPSDPVQLLIRAVRAPGYFLLRAALAGVRQGPAPSPALHVQSLRLVEDSST